MDRRSRRNRITLLVATPGAGKTYAGLVEMRGLLDSGAIQRVVVVVPTEHLKYQWANAGKGILPLHPNWSGDAMEGPDYRGVAVTYQSVAMSGACKTHRLLCSRKRTGVIIDEAHHPAYKKSWGDAVVRAFENAVCRLMMTGTAFRTDEAPMVWCPVENGKIKADYEYGYRRALKERVCREIFFKSYGGETAWSSSRHGEQNVRLNEEISERLDIERLRTFLNPDLEGMATMLREAHQKLVESRREYPAAGALLIASDKAAAEKFCGLIVRVTGRKPALVVSDHEEAVPIEEFEKSNEPWIVAVRQVSEGVDIPRLRVIVYATVWKTEQFFKQAVCRAVRVQHEEVERQLAQGIPLELVRLQPSFVFIPNHPVYTALAQSFEVEREHFVRELEQQQASRTGEPGSGDYFFNPIRATGEEGDTISVVGVLPKDEIEEAREMKRMYQAAFSDASPEQIAKYERVFKLKWNIASDRSTAGQEAPHEEESRLRQRAQKMASKRDDLIGAKYGTSHADWLRKGGMPATTASLDDLRRKCAWLEEEIARIDKAANPSLF